MKKIYAKNNKGAGCSFFITLPALHEKKFRREVTGKILIIDDERAIRRTLREILEFEEFEVDEAENGKDGLEKALAKAYDIIFCAKNWRKNCRF